MKRRSFIQLALSVLASAYCPSVLLDSIQEPPHQKTMHYITDSDFDWSKVRNGDSVTINCDWNDTINLPNLKLESVYINSGTVAFSP